MQLQTSRHFIWVLWAAVGCSADVVVEPPAPPPTYPPPTVTPLDGCASLLNVPAGEAWIGSFHVEPDHSLHIIPACTDAHLGRHDTKRVWVPQVYVDSDAITTSCYGYCVDDGSCGEPLDVGVAWRDPTLANHPVIVTLENAESYCAWRGGRLPTMAELARASHGDAANVTTEAGFALAQACWADSDQDCERLHRLGGDFVPYSIPIRSDELDEGPFGHYDLFGSLADLTATNAARDDEAWCALPQGSQAPSTFSSDDTWRVRFWPAHSLSYAVPETPVGANVNSSLVDPENVIPEQVGMRCAYDPVPP